MANRRGWAGEPCIRRDFAGLTDQTLSCKPHCRASGRAARRLPRLTKKLRLERVASGVTPSVSRGTSRLGRRARHSAACRLLRRVRPRDSIIRGYCQRLYLGWLRSFEKFAPLVARYFEGTGS